MNRQNHSVAVLAQLTARINSKENSPLVPLDAFLPYPMADIEVLDAEVGLIKSMIRARNLLPEILASNVFSDPHVSAKLYATYYWSDQGWIYE